MRKSVVEGPLAIDGIKELTQSRKLAEVLNSTPTLPRQCSY